MPTTTRGSRVAVPVATPASPSTDFKRRRFLFSLSASGAGAAAAAIALVPATAGALQPPAAADNDESAYRESPHVRDYYRTTKL